MNAGASADYRWRHFDKPGATSNHFAFGGLV